MLWNNRWFPGTNLQDLNLDWILKKIAALRGGSAGQVLSKVSSKDFDFEWTTGGGGSSGATFIPSVSSAGVISWTNDGGLPNPTPVNIKGPAGPGMPSGGEAGQIPVKLSSTDYDTEWKFPFDKIQNVATSGTDLNNYTTGGCYYFQTAQTPLNKPNDAGSYGFLVVLHGTVLSRLVQYWIDTNSNKIWMRSNHDTTISWSDWERFVSQADLTPTYINPTIVDPLPAGITSIENVNVVQYGAMVQVGLSLVRDSTPITSYNNGIIASGLPHAAYKPFVGSAPIPNCYIVAAGGAHTGRELSVNVGSSGLMSVRYGETAGTYRAVFFYLTDDLAIYN